MKSDHEKDMEIIRAEAKAKMPEGWRRVTHGKTRKGDMFWNFVDKVFYPMNENHGQITSMHYYVIRKIEE